MDFFNSILDNIKQKTTNPFFGTLIFVWLVRNWELVYTVFNFDDELTLAQKVEKISSFYKDKNIPQELWANCWRAFVLLILGYVIFIVSRVIMNFVYQKIIPLLNSKISSNLVVDKNRFDIVKNTRDEYFKIIQENQEKLIQIEQKNSLLTQDLSKMAENLGITRYSLELKEKENKELNNSKSKLTDELIALKNQQERFSKNKLQLLKRKVTFYNNFIKKNFNLNEDLVFDEECSTAFYNLYKSNPNTNFFEIIDSSKVIINKSVIDDKDKKVLLENGLTEIDKDEELVMTDLGSKLLNFKFLFE